MFASQIFRASMLTLSGSAERGIWGRSDAHLQVSMRACVLHDAAQLHADERRRLADPEWRSWCR